MQKPPRQSQTRIVLSYDVKRMAEPALFAKLLQTGYVASVILYDSQTADDGAALQTQAAERVPVIQTAGCAAIIAGDSRIAGRLKADGLHIESSPQDLAAAVAKHSPAMIVGYGDMRTRHSAMEAGESQPDYLFFGRLGRDTKPEPHPRNLALGGWWADLMEIPCIIQGGSDLAGIPVIARLNAEFIALEEAVFAAKDPLAALERAHDLLDEKDSQ